MSQRHPVYTTCIRGSPEQIFDLIADMPHYDVWLPGSAAFGGTTQVSPYPVQLGTRYLDAGPAGERPGFVTEFDRPRRIAFHHTMRLSKGLLAADIDVHVRYTLEAAGASTEVVRLLELTIAMRGLAALAEPLVVQAFHKENRRILAALRRYVEAHPENTAPAT